MPQVARSLDTFPSWSPLVFPSPHPYICLRLSLVYIFTPLRNLRFVTCLAASCVCVTLLSFLARVATWCFGSITPLDIFSVPSLPHVSLCIFLRVTSPAVSPGCLPDSSSTRTHLFSGLPLSMSSDFIPYAHPMICLLLFCGFALCFCFPQLSTMFSPCPSILFFRYFSVWQCWGSDPALWAC